MNPLRQLPALGFGELFDLIEKSDAEQRPELTLLLRSGRELRGNLLRWEHSNLLIQGDGEVVSYIPLSSIEGAVVHWTPEHLAKLFQVHVPQPGDKAPTRLSLKRKVQEIAQSRSWIVQLNLDAYSDDDATLAVLDSLLTEFRRALSSISDDQEGKAALALVREIRIHQDPKGPSVMRDGENISVLTGSYQGLATKMSSQDLLQALERVL